MKKKKCRECGKKFEPPCKAITKCEECSKKYHPPSDYTMYEMGF